MGCAHENEGDIAADPEERAGEPGQFQHTKSGSAEPGACGRCEACVQTQDKTNASSTSEGMIISAITYMLAIAAALSAAAILVVKEVFHAALLLIICLLCVAGIFVTFNAEFLAVVQIVVYAGGVLLLIIFGIMLTVRTKGLEADPVQNKFIPAVIGAALLSLLIYSLGEYIPPRYYPNHFSPENIGTHLLTRYVIEFELAGMLLLVSLVGAIVAATNLKKSQL